MLMLSTSAIFLNFYFILMIVFCKSSYGYIVDSDDVTNNHRIDQQLASNLRSFYDRYIRTTKFPRIGRSLLDNDDVSLPFYDMNANTNSEDNNDDENENDVRLVEQRSTLFPRIGKRAFHNLLWANSRTNPHRVFDGQGRYYLKGYDYFYTHQPQTPTMMRYRGK